MIIRARKKHYAQIVELMRACGSEPIPESAINPREIGLVAIRKREVVGFVWATIMAGGKIALTANICVHPKYRKRGIAKRLSARLVKVLSKKNVEQMWAYLSPDDPEFDVIGMHVAKSGLVGAQEDSLKVYGSIDRMTALLGVANA